MGPPLDPIAPLRDVLRRRYEFEREIGQGAFATVYLARDLKHERKVAIKVLHADPSSETGELRFIREIRLLARLQHPNILPLHDSGHVETLLYYVMPYVAGETLRDRINRERQLPVETACNIARDIADALAYAHGEGIIHRDIKPENVLLSAGHPILADFGIARVIDLAGVRQVTQTGMGSPGTPAYMSPEQLMGDKALDGRSDTYSLGCVLFEMLTGRPPFAGKEGFVKRFTEDPPSPSEFRPGLPQWMNNAVTTALARSAADRFPTAQEFVGALTHTADPAPPPHAPADNLIPSGMPIRERDTTPNLDETHFRPVTARRSVVERLGLGNAGAVSGVRRLSRKHVGLVLGAVALVGSAALALKVAPTRMPSVFGSATALDTARFVVIPFAATGNAGKDDATRATEGIYDALTKWNGLPLVTDTRVAQAVAESGKTPATERDALRLAREMRAGKLVWGSITDAKPARVRVHLYDVSTGETKDDFYLSDIGDDSKKNADAATRLLGANRPRAASGGDGFTHSYPAWSAYGRGHLALQQWNLIEAEREFREAIAADADFTPARVWLTQILAWRVPATSAEWRDESARAAAGADHLASREHMLATALSALAAYKYPDACNAYEDMVRSDGKDFVGLFGTGLCRELDSVVVPSPASPSKWRFRSSFGAAANAYMRAVGIDPGGHSILSFERLHQLLPTASTQVRWGTAANQRPFAAFPSLSGDTVAFIPYTVDKFATLSDRSTLALRYAALEHDSEVLLSFATDWTQRSPENADAFEALAEILESRGDVSGGGSGRISALGAIHRARSLAQTPEQKIRVRAREVSIHFKRSEFALSRSLADSVLREATDNDDANLPLLSGLASLTGKIDKTTELVLQVGSFMPPSNVSIPTQVMRPAAAFFTAAAFGACGPYLQQTEAQLDRAIESNVSEENRERLKSDLKERPVTLMAACDGARSLHFRGTEDLVMRMQQDLARGDLRSLRSRLAQISEQLKMQRPADLSLDYVYELARLRAGAGDTTQAIAQLDAALEALPSLSTRWIWDVPTASAAVRAMALRADLATARHDTRTAKRWAGAVAALWANADPPLQPLVTRMRGTLTPVR